MAFVKQQNISKGQRVANALQGAVSGASQLGQLGMNMDKFIADQKMQQEKLMQEKQQFDQQQQEMQMKMFQTASAQQANILTGALSTGDPSTAESYMNANMESYNRWVKFGSIKLPYEDALAQVKDGVKVIGPYQKQVRESLAVIGDPNIAFEKKRAAYMTGTGALDGMKGSARNSLFLELYGTQKTLLDSAYATASDQQAKVNQAKAAVEARPVKPAPETPFNKALDLTQAKAFAAQKDELPKFQTRIANIDSAIGVLDKVSTGPLAGKPAVYFLQKLSKNDAQRLEYFLSQENVQKIMEFAKNAGVRSIDTPEEQKRLLDSIANKEQSAPVLKEAAMTMKSLMQQSITNIQAKESHYKQYGNLRDFTYPDSSGPASNEVIRVTKDGKRARFDATTKAFLGYAE